MFDRPRARRFALRTCGWAVPWALLAATTAACGDTPNNLGVPPPDDSLFFPAGLLLDPDPTRAIDGRARWLLVTNGNNDLAFNAATLVAFDLEAFWAAWYDETTGTAYPYCDAAPGEGVERCVLPPATPTTARRPCRRLALEPSVVECDERPFAAAEQTVRFGNFTTSVTASAESDGVRLWIPVRGDPSLSYVDVPAGEPLRLECGQGTDPIDERLCGDSHKLEYLRNDSSEKRLAREPVNVLISDAPGQRDRLAFVAHSDGRALTIVDLDGTGDGRPSIVHEGSLYQSTENGLGSYGMAQRPCFAAGEGPEGAADPEDNTPAVTEDCTRPLLYASLRRVDRLTSFTASGVRPPALAEVIAAAPREDCFADLPVRCAGDVETCDAPAGACGSEACERVYAGQYCATADEIGQACAVQCEPELRAARRLAVGALPEDQALNTINVLGDVAFSDTRGEELLIVQTNPGALLRMNTSLDDNGDPLDIPAGPPIELCAEPSRMKLYRSGGQRFALVSCFASALVYVIDLDASRVTNAIVVGTGPHDLVIDEAREVLYVANTLEASISVVDLSLTRTTRFAEIARLGLQEPFSQ
jgi:hypothetical protein